MKRLGVIFGIAAVAFLAAWLVGAVGVRRADDFFYDAFYRLRPIKDMSHAEVMLVAVDQGSMDAVDAKYDEGWPWPRSYWGEIATYLQDAGAKVVAFDIVFEHRSPYRDDAAFADAVKKLHVPVIFGATEMPGGDWERFALPLESPAHGAVNLGNDKVYRQYKPEVEGQPSLAEAAVAAAGGDLSWRQADAEAPFLLHYYGPHKNAAGTQTFRYVSAYSVLAASRDGAAAENQMGLSRDVFKGKIVIVCAIALGAFDLKTSPLSDEYPGPEVQATAMENLLHAEYVHVVPRWAGWLAAGLCALLVSAGVVLPRWAWVKVIVPVVVAAVLFAVCIGMFRGGVIWWMSPVVPLMALISAAPLAFGYTYFAEDRQRRFMLKALSKVVSPAIAEQLAQNPGRLALGTVRTEITVLFTDLANFTDLAEGMDVQTLGTFINRYLGEMSAQVFAQDGTLDKYIGDAVMCFWNAPLPQEDHAARACRAALKMIEREHALQAELAETLGKRRVFTRIGIHTATVAVGFIGSEHLYNYTAMGDGVNLASRMEGANKLYGTRALISELTAKAVEKEFYLRRIDILRVKGKKQPMAVYELMGERTGGDQEPCAARGAGYDAAFGHYLARRWDESERLLLELSERFAQDEAFTALLARVRHFRQYPPPETWDGVYVSESK